MKRYATIAEIPGYAEAVHYEHDVRDTAFLCARERIHGFVVKPMSLRAYAELRLAESPFIPPFRTPEPEDLVLFLWRLSPEFTREQSGPAWQQFKKRCRQYFPPAEPLIWRTKGAMDRWASRSAQSLVVFTAGVIAARKFMDETLFDKPAPGSGGMPAPFSDICDTCTEVATVARCPAAAVLDMPLKQIFQMLKVAKINDYRANVRGGIKSDFPLFLNKSDKIVGDYMSAVNHEARQQAANN